MPWTQSGSTRRLSEFLPHGTSRGGRLLELTHCSDRMIPCRLVRPVEVRTSSQLVEISGRKSSRTGPGHYSSSVGSTFIAISLAFSPTPVKTKFQFIAPMNYDRGSSTILLYMLATHPSSEDDHDHDASGLSSSDDNIILGHAANRG
jgi:hypothetical protein